MPSPAVLVPLKAFSLAKSRLADVIDADERAALARTMADRVLAAAGDLPVFVVTDDDEVANWTLDHGASVIRSDGLDLNGSVRTAIAKAARAGHDALIIAHADLPAADRLHDLAWFPGLTLVPDRRDDGTNVVAFAVADGFEPRYGPGSFVRHLDDARARGVAVRVLRRPSLQWDVDVPDDLPTPSMSGSR